MSTPNFDPNGRYFRYLLILILILTLAPIPVYIYVLELHSSNLARIEIDHAAITVTLRNLDRTLQELINASRR